MPTHLTSEQAALARIVCREQFADCQCRFEDDGPCGRCGPAARALIEAETPGNPGRAAGAATLLRGGAHG